MGSLKAKVYGTKHTSLSERLVVEISERSKTSNAFEVALLKNNQVVSVTTSIGLYNAKVLAISMVDKE